MYLNPLRCNAYPGASFLSTEGRNGPFAGRAGSSRIYPVLYIPGSAYLNSELFYYNPVFPDRYHVSVWPAERPPNIPFGYPSNT